MDDERNFSRRIWTFKREFQNMSDTAAQLRVALIRKRQVCEMTGLTLRGLTNRVRKGEFPQPVLLDARQTAWVESEVVEWVAARIADRDSGVLPPNREAIVEGRNRGGQTRAAALRVEI